MQRQHTKRSRRSSSDAGFTVVEMTAAAVILFIVLMGVLGAVQFAGATTQMAAMRQGGVDVATQQIEYDRNLPWAAFGVKYANGDLGSPTGTIPATQTISTPRGVYTVSTSVWWGRDKYGSGATNVRLTVKNVRVTSAWTTPTAGSVTIQTAIFGQGAVSNLGIVDAIGVDVDNPTQRVQGADLVLDPYGSAAPMHAVSGPDGVCTFSDVALGQATFSAGSANYQWLVDPSGLGTPTIVAGYQNLGFFYCQKPSTATIHVHSTSIPNIPGAKVVLTDTDRNLVYTGYTGADGNVTFSQAAGNVNGLPGLWKSKGGGYKAIATTGTVSSAYGTFSISSGGTNYSGLDLLIPDPPSILLSKKVLTTGAPLNGVTWSYQLLNPSGTIIASGTTSADSLAVAVSAAGTYTANVWNVSGFLPTSGYAIGGFNATSANQPFQVPMSPVFTVGVRMSGASYVGAPVTMQNALTGITTSSTAGANPGITDSTGLVSFLIPTTANYNVFTVINGLTYTAPQQGLNALNPPTSPVYIDLTAGKLSVAVPPGGTGWTRQVAIYNAANSLVQTGTVTVAAPTVLFTLPGGMYTITVGGTLAPAWNAWPSTLPANTTNKYKNYALTAPGVLTDGSTYYQTNASAPN